MKTIFRIFLSDIKKIRTNLMAFAEIGRAHV